MTQMPTGSWQCIEQHFKIGATGSLQVSLNGTSLSDATASPINVPALNSFSFGYVSDRTVATRVYMDELVVAGAPIGCAN
jgi:hypothetical protein